MNSLEKKYLMEYINSLINEKVNNLEERIEKLEKENELLKNKTKKCKHDWKVISKGNPFKVQDGDILCWETVKCKKCGDEGKQIAEYK